MRKGIASAALAAALLSLHSLPAHPEDAIVVGGAAGWSSLVRRSAVAEAAGLRNRPVLTLSSASGGAPAGPADDLLLSFDSPDAAAFSDASGRYRVSVPAGVAASGRARAGTGAALFSGAEGIAVAPLPASGALFSPGSRLGDFSLRFWIYPANLENGERLLSWTASRVSAGGARVFQRIDAAVARNRIEWSFADFFAAPDDRTLAPLALASRSRIIPRTWSHHEIRYDSSTGLVEYLVDGALEDAAYATSTGREGGEPRIPVVGSGGSFVVAPRFTGMVDEFRAAAAPAPAAASLSRYPRGGGRAETRFFDLGTTNAEILRLDAAAHEPAESEARFFLRAGDSPYGWKDDDSSWVPVSRGVPLDGKVRGRWVQIAVVLYPDGSGEGAPFVESVSLSYRTDEAPPPPSAVTATARNGAVELKWRPSPDSDLGGYLVYYGEARGEYFGTGASGGESPIDVGLRTSYLVDGLRDGALYYFSIAAYDRADPPHVGEFSREVSARPARTAP